MNSYSPDLSANKNTVKSPFSGPEVISYFNSLLSLFILIFSFSKFSIRFLFSFLKSKMKLPGISIFPYISFLFKRIALYFNTGVLFVASRNESVIYK